MMKRYSAKAALEREQGRLAKGMVEGVSTNRGFHRLALFFAAIPLLAGLAFSAWWAFMVLVDNNWSWHDAFSDATTYQLMAMTVFPVLAALIVALVVYGVVRAIGWVVAGFMQG